MRLLARRLVVVAGLVLAFAGPIVHGEEIPLVTGEHWTRSSEAVKKAYLVGIANMVQLETAYAGAAAGGDNQTMVPRMLKGMRGGNHTLDSVRTGLDRWYAANPGRLERPVLEVIWFEMVVPGAQKAN